MQFYLWISSKLDYVHFSTSIVDTKFKDAYSIYTKIGTEISKSYGAPIGKSNFGFIVMEAPIFEEEWLSGSNVVRLEFDFFHSQKLISIEYDLSGKTLHDINLPKKDEKHNISVIKPLFADIPWYTSKNNVKDKLLNLKYKYDEEKKEQWVPNLSDITLQKYSGTISGKQASIFCLYDDQDMLIRVIIILDTKTSYLETYYSLQRDLEQKYGKPWSTGEKFEYPFKKGDGHLDLAIKSNKAFFTKWMHNSDSLRLDINDKTNVRLSYDSHAFDEYLEFKEKKTRKEIYRIFFKQLKIYAYCCLTTGV